MNYVMGPGIGSFGGGFELDKVIKTFELSLKPNQKKMVNLIKDIPIEYMDISDKVIQKAKRELQVSLDDSLYITLTDHIHTSIERCKEGILLKNHLLLEIKHFYKKEFELGEWTLELIKEKYNISMDEDEARFEYCSDTSYMEDLEQLEE